MSYRYEKGKLRVDRGEFIDKGNYAFDPRHEDFAGGADPEGLRDSRLAFADCDAEAVTAGAGCRAGPGTYLIGSDLTLSASWTICEGAVLKPASGVTVVVPLGSVPGPYQWIDESLGGKVVVVCEGLTKGFRQWRGAATDAPTCPFTWNGEHPLPDVLYIQPDGTAYIDPDYDVADFAPTGSVAYYVDYQNGNDANLGTEAQPLKTIAAAIAKSDVDIIYLAATGVHHKPVMSITRSMQIKPYGGDRAILSEHDPHSWSLTSDTTNVYETSETESVYLVLDLSNEDDNGDAEELTQVESIEDCDSTPGSWFWDGSKVYVHTFDSRTPDTDVFVMVRKSTHAITGNISVYMENVSIYGGARGLLVQSGATLIAKGLHVKYSDTADGIEVSGARGAYLQDCVVAKNATDGLSYRIGSIIPSVLEIRCTSRHNGLQQTQSTQNGTSAHDGVQAVRINGTYWMNKGPNVVDVGGAVSWNVGCSAFDSAAAGSTQQRSNFFIQDGHMWIEGGESRVRPNSGAGQASLYDLVVERGYMHIRDLRHGYRTAPSVDTPSVVGVF